MSSMVATLEPIVQKVVTPVRGGENLAGLEKHSQWGKLNIQIKRHNGRANVIAEEFHIYREEVKFVPVSSRNQVINQTLLPKLQFNLQLSEKEVLDRAKMTRKLRVSMMVANLLSKARLIHTQSDPFFTAGHPMATIVAVAKVKYIISEILMMNIPNLTKTQMMIWTFSPTVHISNSNYITDYVIQCR